MKKKMKKQTARSVTHRKTVKPALPSGRIIIISGFVAVILAAFIVAGGKPLAKEVVLGTSIKSGFYNEGNIFWQPVSGAVGYNIYYGVTGQPFRNAVRNIPANITSYTVQALKKNVNYSYQVSAIGVDNMGNQSETWFSPITPITNLQGM